MDMSGAPTIDENLREIVSAYYFFIIFDSSGSFICGIDQQILIGNDLTSCFLKIPIDILIFERKYVRNLTFHMPKGMELSFLLPPHLSWNKMATGS